MAKGDPTFPGMSDMITQSFEQTRNAMEKYLDLFKINMTASPLFTSSDLTKKMQRYGDQNIEAANGVTAKFLSAHKVPSIRRVVRSPERWPRIVDLAQQHGTTLPGTPDARALEAFLRARRAAAPDDFADLSLSVIKLLGRGEYVAEGPAEPIVAPFCPRGFELHPFDRAEPALSRSRHPAHAQGRHRQAAGAVRARRALRPRRTLHQTGRRRQQGRAPGSQSRRGAVDVEPIGQEFNAVVTGASAKGTWVRIERPPVEAARARGRRTRRRRSPQGPPAQHRPRTRLHRFCKGGEVAISCQLSAISFQLLAISNQLLLSSCET